MYSIVCPQDRIRSAQQSSFQYCAPLLKQTKNKKVGLISSRLLRHEIAAFVANCNGAEVLSLKNETKEKSLMVYDRGAHVMLVESN